MVKIKFTDVKTVICGIQGSGKSFYTEKVVTKAFKKPFIYRVHLEDFNSCHDGCVIYTPVSGTRIDSTPEHFDKVLGVIIQEAKRGKYDAIFIDEADLLIPKDQRTMQKYHNLNDLVLNHRHYGLGVVFITRRPQDLPTVIVESSMNIITFAIEGDNVQDKFSRIHPDFEILLPKLSQERHNYIYKKLGQAPILCSPYKVKNT